MQFKFEKWNGLGNDFVIVNGAEEVIENMDEVLFLISRLPEREAKIVRMYHLEQKSYAEIAEILSIPVNTVGPTLSRARDVMRRG